MKISLPSGTVPYMGDVYYGYSVPEGATGPLDVKVIVDADGLFSEIQESNNSARATIPVQATGGSGPDLSITAGNQW